MRDLDSNNRVSFLIGFGSVIYVQQEADESLKQLQTESDEFGVAGSTTRRADGLVHLSPRKCPTQSRAVFR